MLLSISFSFVSRPPHAFAQPASARRPSFLFPLFGRRSESNRIRPTDDRRHAASSTRVDGSGGWPRVREPDSDNGSRAEQTEGDQRQARDRPVRLDATRMQCSAVQSRPRMHCPRSHVHAHAHDDDDAGCGARSADCWSSSSFIVEFGPSRWPILSTRPNRLGHTQRSHPAQTLTHLLLELVLQPSTS